MKIVTKMMMVLTISSFVISQGLFNQYDIPEYQYSTFQVSGQDLFDMRSQGDVTTTNMNVGANYMSMSQSPGFNLMYGLNFDYDSADDGSDGDDASTSNWTMDVPFAADKYFGNTKGAFGFAEGTLSMWGGDNVAEGDDDTGDLHLTIGAGFGRVVSAKPVAQAYAIADAIGGDDSDDTILAIAAVLGKGMEYYTQEYKDDADQQYYNDLAEAAGDAGSAMTIRKVLESPAYNISDRFAGWSVKAGLVNNYMNHENCDDCEDAGYMFAEAAYAMPMDVNAQLMVSATMYMDLNAEDAMTGGGMYDSGDYDSGDYDSGDYDSGDYDSGDYDSGDYDSGDYGSDGGDDMSFGDLFDDNGTWTMRSNEATVMHLNVTYSLDHSYNWSTSAWFDYASMTPGGEDPNTTSLTTIGVSTTKSVLNKMSVTGNFGYEMMSFGIDGVDDPDPTMTISSQLTYWVF